MDAGTALRTRPMALLKNVIKETLGLDFDDEGQRGRLIDMMIDRLFCEAG